MGRAAEMLHFAAHSCGTRPALAVVLTGIALPALLAGCDAPDSGILAPPPTGVEGALTRPASGTWSALIFMASDCPVSNHYVPEIRRICDSYEPAGVRCTLVYSAPQLRDSELRQHLADFNLDLPAVLDADRTLTARAEATVTPQAAVFTPEGALAYSGRIDNLFAALGRRRQSATQHDLRDALDDLVAGRPVRAPRTQAVGCYIE